MITTHFMIYLKPSYLPVLTYQTMFMLNTKKTCLLGVVINVLASEQYVKSVITNTYVSNVTTTTKTTNLNSKLFDAIIVIACTKSYQLTVKNAYKYYVMSIVRNAIGLAIMIISLARNNMFALMRTLIAQFAKNLSTIRNTHH